MRLTEEELADIEEHIGQEEIHPTECQQMVEEIKERRAADLSDEDREALVWIRAFVIRDCAGDEIDLGPEVVEPERSRALAVLDRLLSGGGK